MRDTVRLPREALDPYCLELPRPLVPTRVSWSDLFDNLHAVEIEVGFGKGQFLVTEAGRRPTTNFLGIEVDRGLQLYAANRLAKRSLVNARVACIDAGWFLEHCVAPGSVQAVHVYFPDPWWKRRHRKRRVFTAEFAAAAERALRPGGTLLIGTDVEEYFKVMTKLVAVRPGLLERGRRVETGPPEPGANLTNFERKAREKGGSVWRAEYERGALP